MEGSRAGPKAPRGSGGRGLRQPLPAAPCALSHDTFSGALGARVRSSEARTMVSASADRLGGSPRPDYCSPPHETREAVE